MKTTKNRIKQSLTVKHAATMNNDPNQHTVQTAGGAVLFRDPTPWPPYVIIYSVCNDSAQIKRSDLGARIYLKS